jgi:hypothetical protein
MLPPEDSARQDLPGPQQAFKRPRLGSSRARVIILSIALALVAIISATLLSSPAVPGPINRLYVYGVSGTTYELVVAPSKSGDTHTLTKQQARNVIDHPIEHSIFSTKPKLILFGFGRVTARAIGGPVPLEKYNDRPAWVGVYAVPSKSLLLKCEGGTMTPPATKPPNTYYFARIVNPENGHQAFWNENASTFFQWLCSGRKF